MQGTFRYTSKPLIVVAVLLFLLIPFMPTVYAVLLVFGSSAATLFLSFHIPGSFTADTEGVTIRKLMKAYRFDYRDIRSVEAVKNLWGGTGGVQDFGTDVYIHLTIRTTDRAYTFHSNNRYSLREHMDYPENIRDIANEMPFTLLENYIRSHLNQ